MWQEFYSLSRPSRADTCAPIIACMQMTSHGCTIWQVHFLTFHSRRILPTAPLHTLHTSHMHWTHAHTALPTCLPLAHKPAWHLSWEEGRPHTGSRSQSWLCCLPPVWPFDPLTGTQRILKWVEEPRSSSTSPRRALSVGSCPTPQGSRGNAAASPRKPQVHNCPLRKRLECYLHVSAGEAGGQEVRQEHRHL